MLQITK